MIDYKKLYAQTYGITWDADLEIHHIDRDRKNNHISNLILLPSYLHEELHDCLDESEIINEQVEVRDLIETMMRDMFNFGKSYHQEVFLRLSYILSECKRWGLLKCISYKYPNGSTIEHITKDTMAWIE